MLLSFPYMHSELFSGDPVPGIRFFDPGLSEEVGENGYRPEALPMDRKTATALINDCINFGEQFKDPSEMAYFGVMSADDFYEGSPNSIRAQLTRQFDDGQGSKQERERKEAESRAQFILLLAWFFEERMIELASLEKGVKNSWKTMVDDTLGMDDEDRLNERLVDLGKAESHTGGASDGQSVPLPWQRIIEALPAFVPEDCVYVCTNKDIIDTWDDLEIPFAPYSGDEALPEGTMAVTLPAWKFAGRRKAPGDMPQALKDVTVAIIR